MMRLSENVKETTKFEEPRKEENNERRQENKEVEERKKTESEPEVIESKNLSNMAISKENIRPVTERIEEVRESQVNR